MSLYKELYGSNNWNGTAVAFILLMGAIGAITPVALGVNRPNPLGSIKSTYQRKGRYLPLPLNHNSTDRTNIDIVSNSIDVHSMEDAEKDLALDTTSKSESKIGNSFLFQNNLQSPKSVNQFIAECEMNRNKEIYCLSANTSLLLFTAGAISIASLTLFLLSWSAIPSIGMLGLFFASWQCISAIILTQLAQYLTSLTAAVTVTVTSDNQMHSKNQQESESWVGAENIIVEDVIHNQLNPFYNETNKCQETESQSISDIQIKSNMNMNINDSDNNDDDINDRTVGVKDLIVKTINLSQSLCKGGDEDDKDRDGGRHGDDEAIRCREEEEEGEGEVEGEGEEDEDEEEDAMKTSPFSLAVVAIVGMSVLLQGFLQGMFFTYFGLPLRSAFSILLIIYVLSTLLFVLGCVARVRGQESGVL